jgi:hypothetical protein
MAAMSAASAHNDLCSVVNPSAQVDVVLTRGLCAGQACESRQRLQKGPWDLAERVTLRAHDTGQREDMTRVTHLAGRSSWCPSRKLWSLPHHPWAGLCQSVRALTRWVVQSQRFDTVFEAWAYFDLDGDWELSAPEFKILSVRAGRSWGPADARADHAGLGAGFAGCGSGM